MRPPLRSRQAALAGALLMGVVASQIGSVRLTNFYGYDEWTILYLLAHGVIDIPYANRPLELLWALPAAWIDPHSFFPWAVLYWVYASLQGLVVFWLCRRLSPDRPLLAFLAACFVVVWAPTDLARLSHVERMLYAGISFGMVLAATAFVESFVRRSPAWLAAACLLCVVSGRCYEATLPVLLLAPVFILLLERRPTAAFWQWTLAWEGFATLALLLALQPQLFPSGDPVYQGLFGLDPRPSAVLRRLALQYWFHLGPLVLTPLLELRVTAVPVAASSFAVALLIWARTAPRDGASSTPSLGSLMGVGGLLAGAGYSALVLTPQAFQPWRMQFLSGLGIALLLAAALVRLGTRLGRRGLPVIVIAGAWVVGVGTGRTVAMQKTFDAQSLYPVQTRMLKGLIASAPDVKPHTLIVLLDQGGAWRADFGFRHAVELLYRGRAIGYVPGSWDAMFPTFFDAQGIRCEPWLSIRGPWAALPTHHEYAEVVVVRFTPDGDVVVADSWPPELPGLPADARYAPRSRIVASAAPIPERRALFSLEGG